MFIAIWSEDANNGIGLNGAIPWKIQDEKTYLKKFVNGKKVLIGKNAFLLLKSKLEFSSDIFVVTQNDNLKEIDERIRIIHNLEEFINRYKNSEEIVYVLGGKQIIESIINDCKHAIYLKHKQKYPCDTFLKIDYKKFIITDIENFENSQIFHCDILHKI